MGNHEREAALSLEDWNRKAALMASAEMLPKLLGMKLGSRTKLSTQALQTALFCASKVHEALRICLEETQPTNGEADPWVRYFGVYEEMWERHKIVDLAPMQDCTMIRNLIRAQRLTDMTARDLDTTRTRSLPAIQEILEQRFFESDLFQKV